MNLLKNNNYIYKKLTILGVLSVISIGFAIPVSTALTNIFTALACLFWLISGQYRNLYALFSDNPVIRTSLLLFILFCARIAYSSAGFNEALNGVSSYRKLFLIVVFASFMDKKAYRHWAINSFFGGCLILLVISYMLHWNILSLPSLPHDTITSPITHNLFMAFFAFHLAIEFMEASHFKAVYGVLLILVFYNIFFIVTGRSGYVVFVFLLIFFLYHFFDKKKLMLGIMIIGVLLLLSLCFKNKFSYRMIQTKNNIESYLKTGKNNTSVGQRLDFAKTSWELFLKKPFTGYGTGSFKKEYKKLSRLTKTFKTDNPHNEYLSIAVQLGSTGLILFIYLLYVQWKYSKKLDNEKWLAQGFILFIIIGSLMNSMLLDSGEGHFFAYFTAVLFTNSHETTMMAHRRLTNKYENS